MGRSLRIVVGKIIYKFSDESLSFVYLRYSFQAFSTLSSDRLIFRLAKTSATIEQADTCLRDAVFRVGFSPNSRAIVSTVDAIERSLEALPPRSVVKFDGGRGA